MYKRNLVSIIVPTHNRADMLGRTLNSIKKQTYKNWEVIVVANNCKDHTCAVVKEYLGDDRTTFINIPEPIGAQKARNMGIQLAKGEYIAFLDDDDEWFPDKTKKQVDFFEKNLDFSAVSCSYLINVNDKTHEVIIPQVITFDDLLWDNYFGSFSFCMVRHNVFEKIGLLDENLPSCQDWDFWLRVMQRFKVGIIPEYLVVYHRHNQQRISSMPQGKVAGIEGIYYKYKKYMNKECQRQHLKYIYYYKSLSSFSKKDRFRYFIKMLCFLSKKEDLVLSTISLCYLVLPEMIVNIIKKYFWSKIVFRKLRIENKNNLIMCNQ